MTIQETIIEALKASQGAHGRALATIAGLRADKGALEAEVVRLNTLVASLKMQVSHLETEARKIVEPSSVQTLLTALHQMVEETHQATASASAAPAPAPAARREADMPREEPRPDEAPPSPIAVRPILRQILDRDFSSQEPLEAAR